MSPFSSWIWIKISSRITNQANYFNTSCFSNVKCFSILFFHKESFIYYQKPQQHFIKNGTRYQNWKVRCVNFDLEVELKCRLCWVWVNQRLYFPLSAMGFLLLAWYQQAGRWWEAAESGKYIDVSGKWSHYFTLTCLCLETYSRICYQSKQFYQYCFLKHHFWSVLNTVAQKSFFFFNLLQHLKKA